MAAPAGPGRDRLPSEVVVEASLDNLTSAQVRFLHEASRHGRLHVRVASDDLVRRLTGAPPAFPEAERRYLARSLRCVNSVGIVDRTLAEAIEEVSRHYRTIVLKEGDGDPGLGARAAARGMRVIGIGDGELAGYPEWFPGEPDVPEQVPGGPDRTIVTGCYDWLHSGHIRFFMDAAATGELYVVVGSDRNVELLKGPGHPLQHEEERRYMVGAVRHVHRCLVSTGSGWMDAEPEVARIRPRSYVVNEDGDKPDKREFCASHGVEYVVLRRVPHRGLPARSSTELRGF
jgi:cytidyltransferase-like protein